MDRNDEDGRPPASTMHHGVLALLAGRGVRPSAAEALKLDAKMRSLGELMTLRRDGDRLHPMGMRVTTGRTCGNAYLSASEADGRMSTTIVLPDRRLPSTIAASAAGRLLDDVAMVDGLPSDLVIRSITDMPSIGTVIMLEDDYRPVARNDNTTQATRLETDQGE